MGVTLRLGARRLPAVACLVDVAFVLAPASYYTSRRLALPRTRSTMQELVDDMSIKELKRTIIEGGLSHAGCTEKAELRALAMEALNAFSPTHLPTPPSSHQPAKESPEISPPGHESSRQSLCEIEPLDDVVVEHAGSTGLPGWRSSSRSGFRFVPASDADFAESEAAARLHETTAAPRSQRRAIAFCVALAIACWVIFFWLVERVLFGYGESVGGAASAADMGPAGINGSLGLLGRGKGSSITASLA